MSGVTVHRSTGGGILPAYRERHTDFDTAPLSPKQVINILHGKRTRGKHGDILVVLHRGQPGIKRTQRRTLKALALNKIGDARLGNSTDGSFAGQYKKQPQQFRIIEFDEPVQSEALSNGGRNDMSEKFVSYGSGYNAGEILTLEDEEYFQVELSDGSPSIVWSSDATVTEVVGELISRQAPGSADGTVVLRNATFRSTPEYEESVGEGSADEIVDFVLTAPEDVAYAKIPFARCTLIWRRDAVKFPGSSTPRPEVSLIYPQAVIEFDVGFLTKTSSPDISHHSDEIVKSSRFISAAGVERVE